MAPDLRTRAERTLHGLWLRSRLLLRRPLVPDAPDAPEDPRQQWRRQLDRTRAGLELARDGLARDGWVQDGWFATRAEATLLTGTASYARLRTTAGRSELGPACLVGTLLRLAEDPDRPTSIDDVRHAVDELYGALAEQEGHPARPPGTAYPLAHRRLHVRALTAWNDAPGRRHDEVTDLVERAVSRTIVGACA